MDYLEKKIKVEGIDLLSLFGSNDKFLQLIENNFHSIITVRGNEIILKGDAQEIQHIDAIFKELIYLLNRNGIIKENDVLTVMKLVEAGKREVIQERAKTNEQTIFWGAREPVRARTPKQFEYVTKVRENDLTFAIGPAGTGKTFLAVAMALDALKKNEITKIIITRPAVEAGESLGFLPGDLNEKLNPYLQPLYDAMFQMLNAEKLKGLFEKNVIEIIPLAYMRGRTLNNAFIILDEAQNTTVTQMKMFLTRLGANSKSIITGDITQIDLPTRDNSGLIHAKNILKKIPDIAFVYFDKSDVVRHKLVAEIIKAYEIDAMPKDYIDEK